jgi:hypothetical protein
VAAGTRSRKHKPQQSRSSRTLYVSSDSWVTARVLEHKLMFNTFIEWRNGRGDGRCHFCEHLEGPSFVTPLGHESLQAPQFPEFGHTL